MSGYIVRNEYGAFCTACGAHLTIEEDDWDVCDACDGEGYEGDEDHEPETPQDHTPPDLKAVLADALAKQKTK